MKKAIVFLIVLFMTSKGAAQDLNELQLQLQEARERQAVVQNALVGIVQELSEIDAIIADVQSKIGEVPPPVPVPVTRLIVDDGDSDFSVTGNWTSSPTQTYGRYGDVTYAPAGGGNSEANWGFSIPAGSTFTVFMSWVEHPNRATNTRVLVDNQEFTVNQQVAPGDISYDGFGWKKIGGEFTSRGSVLVTMVDGANGYVIADAVMILAESDEPVSLIRDDADATFVGTWDSLNLGYNGGARYHEPGSGSDKATWSFGNLFPGQYTVYATWPVGPAHATNTPFYSHVGEGTYFAGTVNQQEHPTTVIDGVEWEELDVITTHGTFIDIWTNDFANGNVIADAVRLVPSNEPPPPDGTGELLVYINAERERLGVHPLVRDDCLDRVAYERSFDLSLRPPMNPHEGAAAAIRSCAFYSVVGENAGFNYPTPDSMFIGWVDSMSHYLAMTSSAYYLCGIGFDGSYAWYLELAG